MSPEEPRSFFIDGACTEDCTTNAGYVAISYVWQDVKHEVRFFDESTIVEVLLANELKVTDEQQALDANPQATAILVSPEQRHRPLKGSSTNCTGRWWNHKTTQHPSTCQASSTSLASFRARRMKASDVPDYILWSMIVPSEVDSYSAENEISQYTSDTSSWNSCHLKLASSLRGRGRVETWCLLQALYVVSISFRRLLPTELYDAVLNLAMQQKSTSSRFLASQMTQDGSGLVQLCSDLLVICDNGELEFRSSTMRQFLLGSSVPEVSNRHHSMARLCLHYLGKAGRRLVLRPWTNFRQSVKDFASKPFLNYVLSYWPKHYREAEAPHNDLPAQLHRLIELDVLDYFSKQDYLSIQIRRFTLDTGLALCAEHDFIHLQSTYRRMGGRAQRQPFCELDIITQTEVDLLKHELLKQIEHGHARHVCSEDKPMHNGPPAQGELDDGWIPLSRQCTSSVLGIVCEPYKDHGTVASEIHRVNAQMQSLAIDLHQSEGRLHMNDQADTDMSASDASFYDSQTASTAPSSPGADAFCSPFTGRNNDLPRFPYAYVQQDGQYSGETDWCLVNRPEA